MDLQKVAEGMPTALRGVLQALLAEHDSGPPAHRATIAVTVNILAIACARVERALKQS
jgi:hypothetical protein